MFRELPTEYRLLATIAGLIVIIGLLLAPSTPVKSEGTVRLNGAVPNHGGDVTAVAFSPDGQILASAGRDGAIRFWNVQTGALTAILTDNSGQVLGISFAPNGDFLASSTLDRLIRLWDVRTGAVVTRFQIGAYGSESVSFFPDGQRLIASSSGDDALSVVHASTGKRIYDVPILRDRRPLSARELPRLPGNSCHVDSVAVSRDGKSIASSDICGIIALRKADDGSLVHLLERQYVYSGFVPARSAGKTQLSFSVDNMLAGGSGESVVIWDVTTGKEAIRLTELQGRVTAVSFQREGEAVVASGSSKGAVTLWDLSNHRPKWRHMFQGEIKMINDVAISPDGKMVAIAHWQHPTLIDVETGEITRFNSAAR
jgi:WD40 repeat protein